MASVSSGSGGGGGAGGCFLEPSWNVTELTPQDQIEFLWPGIESDVIWPD